MKRYMAGLLLSLGFQANGMAQVAPALSGGLQADSGRGILTEKQGPLEMQQTCPQRVGDAYDSVNERTWNMLEFGVQVPTQSFPNPKFQAYTRYTCDTPFERTRRRQF